MSFNNDINVIILYSYISCILVGYFEGSPNVRQCWNLVKMNDLRVYNGSGMEVLFLGEAILKLRMSIYKTNSMLST